MNRTTRGWVMVGVWMLLALPHLALAEPEGLNETTIRAYLEKKVLEDPGACLVDNMNLDIVGISDVVPGYQVEVFYTFTYELRCNRTKESKSGQGVLRGARLREGNWIDRDTATPIAK